jgi:hypothetical protein
VKEAPTIPVNYLKFHAKKGGTGGKLLDVEDEVDQNKVFFEPLSFKKLERVISKLHPTDPDTKKRFSYKSKITVKDYGAKIADTCCCYKVS